MQNAAVNPQGKPAPMHLDASGQLLTHDASLTAAMLATRASADMAAVVLNSGRQQQTADINGMISAVGQAARVYHLEVVEVLAEIANSTSGVATSVASLPTRVVENGHKIDAVCTLLQEISERLGCLLCVAESSAAALSEMLQVMRSGQKSCQAHEASVLPLEGDCATGLSRAACDALDEGEFLEVVRP